RHTSINHRLQHDPEPSHGGLMATLPTAHRPLSTQTHEVFNQPPPLEPYNKFEADTPLKEAIDRENAGWGVDRLRDIDEVALDPSWHWLLKTAVEREIPSLPWRDPQAGAHVVRGALMYVFGQVNGGVMCPVSMTYAVIPALREQPDLAAEWEPRLTKP